MQILRSWTNDAITNNIALDNGVSTIMLGMLDKNFRWQFIIFFFCSQKIGFTFHANCLHWETICMECQSLFSRKNIIKLYDKYTSAMWTCSFDYLWWCEHVHLTTSGDVNMFIWLPQVMWTCSFDYLWWWEQAHLTTSGDVNMFIWLP